MDAILYLAADYHRKVDAQSHHSAIPIHLSIRVPGVPRILIPVVTWIREPKVAL